MKFNEKGMRVDTKSKSVCLSSTPYTLQIPMPDPETIDAIPFEMDVSVDNALGNWGISHFTVVKVDVKAIAYNVHEFAKRLPNSFPYVESIVEGVSETSVHELVHRLGQVIHDEKGLTSIDFENVTNEMGAGLTVRMRKAINNEQKSEHSIQVIDLPEMPEDRPNKPNIVTIGNMVLNVRLSA